MTQEKRIISIPKNAFVASKYVFEWEGNLYRGFTPDEVADSRRGIVLNTMSANMDKLHSLGLIHWYPTSLTSEEFSTIVQLERIDFVSYYDEWTKQMIADAGVVMLDVLEGLVEAGYCLFDGHPYNMLFNYTQPVFVDLDSIIPLTLSISWYTEFYLSFIKPLYPQGEVAALAFWTDITDRTISNKTRVSSVGGFREAFLQLIIEVRNWILSISVKPSVTPWSGYAQPTDELTNGKQKTTYYLLNKLYSEGMTLIDMGSNEGWYSHLAASCGYKVVSFDLDESCINSLYVKAKTKGSRILPLMGDFLHPWVAQSPYSKAVDRLKCDVGLALALMHHLVFSQHSTFDVIASRLNDFSKKYAIVEFPPEDDMFVKNWVTPTTSWYTMDNFIKEMLKYFSKVEVFDSSPEPRKIILFEK